jgi:rubrerythrin
MPEFANPFSGMTSDRKLTLSELIRALRLNIAAEEEAIHLYMAHADATDHPLAKEVLIDIANEEREHVGEFQRLIDILDPEEKTLLNNGAEEVNEMAGQVGSDEGATPEEDKNEPPSPPSVGNLKE